jgi:cobalt-zinc-cadmium resistance protein CzcA
MIRALIDHSLNSRFLVVVGAVLLLIWGAISFHNLPIEAYPDVANNYVQVITQWPGHAAEEVEQQVTGATSGARLRKPWRKSAAW